MRTVTSDASLRIRRVPQERVRAPGQDLWNIAVAAVTGGSGLLGRVWKLGGAGMAHDTREIAVNAVLELRRVHRDRLAR